MGAIAHLEPRSIAVAPGGEAATEIRVRNGGNVVDQFTIWILGDAEPWSVAEPQVLSLLPGTEERARIVFRPPRAPNVPAGPMAFGVQVQSKEDPAGSVVEEGVLEIAPFADTFAELVPRTSRGSGGATHDLAIDNRGNARLNATISAADPDRLLDFDVQPPGVVADPGTAAFAKVRVKPRQRFWRGTPQTRPFRVQVESPEAPPFGVDGTLLQEAILPPWLMRALLALIGLLIGLVLLWILFLRPQIEAAARDQTAEVLASLGLTLPPPQTPGPQPTPGGGGGNGPSPGGGNGESPGGGNGASPSPGGGPPTPMATLPGGVLPRDGRITETAPAAPQGAGALFVTDLLFSNPAVDPAVPPTGNVELRRVHPGGEDVLIVLRAENFRDLDFHFVTPIAVQSGQQLALRCNINNSGTCGDVSVYFSGFER